MATHKALVTVAARAPLEIIQVPTIQPVDREVLLRVQYTASTPLDLHQADSGLLITHPHILGDSVAGTIISIGPLVHGLKVGDQVFGFTFETPKCSAHQELVTVSETSLSKLPPGFTLQQAVTLPSNVTTIFHTVTSSLSLPLPWPRPASPPAEASTPILIWGGASSCGLYALQILSHWGYSNLLATSSPAHHAHLRSLGARHCFNYRDGDVVTQILNSVGDGGVKYVLDCIGSKHGSLIHEAAIAGPGSKVAVLLPVIVKDATEDEAPEYALEVQDQADWKAGVEVVGVRTHFYKDNELFREHLQPTIVPALLAEDVVKPNRQRIVEGATLLERGQKALNILRRKEARAERLVWRVSED